MQVFYQEWIAHLNKASVNEFADLNRNELNVPALPFATLMKLMIQSIVNRLPQFQN
jgi:hypothetical protein